MTMWHDSTEWNPLLVGLNWWLAVPVAVLCVCVLTLAMYAAARWSLASKRAVRWCLASLYLGCLVSVISPIGWLMVVGSLIAPMVYIAAGYDWAE